MTTQPQWRLLPVTRFPECAQSWRELNDRVGPSPLWHPDFVASLLEHFSDGSERLAICECLDETVAMAIVVRTTAVSWQTFQPSQAPIGMWMSAAETDIGGLSRVLLNELPGVTLAIGITQQDPQLMRRPLQMDRLRSLDYIETAHVDVRGSFEAYWEGRGKNLRRNTRRDRAWLEKNAIKTQLDCVTEATAVEKAIADYARLETTGWKAEAGTAVALDTPQGCFYRDLLTRFCQRGAGRIYRYWFNDAVVAMDLCIQNDATLVVLKTAYDESIKSVSPAVLMRQEEFRHVFEERQIAKIEFYGRLMEWHTRWTDESRTLFHLNCYRWPWLRAVHDMRSARISSRASDPSSPTQRKNESQ